VLPLLALLFRRGWICGLVLVVLLPVPRAQAFEWRDLWLRRDQRAYEALQDKQPARAATLFENPEWRGAAQFRSGEFDASAATLASIDSAEGQYNRGNALAKAGKLEPAIEAYDRALALNADHEDARFNRDLLKKFLADHPPPEQPQQQQQQQDQNGQDNQGKRGDSKDSAGDGEQRDAKQSGEEQSQKGDKGKSGEAQGNGDSDEKQKDGEQQEQNAANPQQQNGPDSPNKAPGPEDVEKWASEQAAEQWLRRVPQDPGGLLRRKFLYQYQRMGVDQDGKPVLQNGPERKPW
jgi:Ca-activated chloride channel family protein